MASHASGRRLWDKNEPLDALIEQFTVGDDYRLDRALVAADCVASLAHATMLAAIEVITPTQLEELRGALLEALELAQRRAFSIERADEDGHTALERFLTRRTAAGARIHTGRSRNDQVMAALRLYGREALTELQHYRAGSRGSPLCLRRPLRAQPHARPYPYPGGDAIDAWGVGGGLRRGTAG